MLRLEQLEKGTLVEGIEPDGPVRIVNADLVSEDTAEVFYVRVSDGGSNVTMLYRSGERDLRAVSGESLRGFSAPGEDLRLATEAYRLNMAYLSDPMIAVHTSLIEPLPHQISAVYEYMLARQPLRFLLADDPGAGKTIMAGLLMKELLVRGDLERALICCPGGLVEQWQDELWQKFGLPFEIIGREQVEASRTGNPFAEKDLAIGRLDHMSRNEDIKQGLQSTEWDLIVVDEAHKMSASFSGGEIDKTKRYQLGELLSPLTRHLLLMSATPHNGKEEDFQLFLKLLDADRFEGRFRDGVHHVETSDIMRRMVKEDLKRFDGENLFPPRRAHTVGYRLSPEESRLYEDVTDYVRQEFNRAEATEGRVRTVGFALTILQRRMASSPEAIYQSLKRRRNRLQQRLKEVKTAGRRASLRGGELDRLAGKLEDYEEVPGEELEQAEEEVMDAATAARNARELEIEIQTLQRLEREAELARDSGRDRKWERLRELLEDEDLMRDAEGDRRKIIVFTEHRDTLEYLCERLTRLFGREEAVIRISGGMSRDGRRGAQERFLNNPEATVLVATDAAGEGVNLQRANLMVNYDLPWNPNRLEQRFGRIHRIGQTETCHLWNLIAEDTREGDVYARLLDKLETERQALGGRVFDVLGDLFREKSLRELLIEAIRDGNRGHLSHNVADALESAMEHERLRSLIEDTALTHEAMDPTLIRRIRDEMERAEARRLQPHFIESFFVEAFRRLGGSPKEREPGRYELPRVPHAVYRRAREMPGGSRIADAYQRITFDKSLVRADGKPLAKFLHPGHPLLDAVVDLTLQRHRSALAEGGVLVDDTDPGNEPRALVLLEHAIEEGSSDSSRPTASRRMQFVEVAADGSTTNAGHAPHLDYRPPTGAERESLDLSHSFGAASEESARRWAAANLVPGHLEEVTAQREERINKTERAVWERLTKEISYWDRRSAELRQQERSGQPNDRLNSENAARRRDDLIERRDRRMQQLKRERHLMPGPPVVVGAALVMPAGMVEDTASKDARAPRDARAPAFTADPEARRRVEERAMQAVFAAELALGHSPRDVAAQNLGYDIESRDSHTGRLRMIEVKGRAAGAETVTITRNEILTAMNRPDDFILALVEVEGESASSPRYVRRPFSREPDFDATSVNYDLRDLLERGEEPS